MPECGQGHRPFLSVATKDNIIFYKVEGKDKSGCGEPKKQKPRKPGILSVLLIAVIFLAAVYFGVDQTLHVSGMVPRM